MNKLVDYLKSSYEELRTKVAWPKYNELQSSSILVLVASLIFALLIGAFDFAFEETMQWFYNAF